MNEVIAGIDIGGTKIAIALGSMNGKAVASRRLPTQTEIGPHRNIENVLSAIEEMLAENKAKLVSIGVGCPAPLDLEKGLIVAPSNLPGWNDFPIVQLLEDYFKVPVVLDNDANTATLGEYIYGAGRGYKNIVYITVSTGIGGGIIINGDLIHGVGWGAGELGHTIVQPDGVRCNCGLIGCLETICSGIHIARRAKERLAKGEPTIINELVSNINDVTAKTVVEAVRRNDPLACEVWDETCRFLALGIGNMITLLAPEAVIIGGGIASAGDLLLAPVRALIPQFVSMVPVEKIDILPAELDNQSGICGALILAKQVLLERYQPHAI